MRPISRAILTELAWSIKDLCIWHYKGALRKKRSSYLCLFSSTEEEASYMQKVITHFGFLVLWFHPDREITEKSFYCHGKYFAEENFHAPAWTSVKCYCGNKTGNPKRAVSLCLACSGSQSQHGIWFTLPALGACHIINTCESPP